MAKNDRKRFKQVVTPVGTAVWPSLTTPDYTYKAEGEYHTKLRVIASAAGALMEQIEAVHEEAIAAAKKETGKSKVKLAALPFKDELEKTEDGDEEGEPTGYVLFKVKSTASGKTKEGREWKRSLTIKDAAGNDFTGVVHRGSEIRMIISLKPYYTAALGAGVTLLIEKVQVIKAAPPPGKKLDVDFEYVDAASDQPAADVDADDEEDATQF